MSDPLAIASIVVGSALVVGSGALAVRGVSPHEERLFRTMNQAPDAALVPVFVPMQFGTYVTTPAIAIALWATGRPDTGVAVFIAGTASWLLAKLVKRIAERGRPQHALGGEVRLRGPREGGSGFPSGHAATSTALAIVLGSAFGGWWWLPLIALTLATWYGRLYVGVHLPLDIAGGAGIGIAMAGLTLLAVGTG